MSDNSNLIADALLHTNESLYNAIDGGNSWLASLVIRGARVALFRQYERGDHRADITTQMRKMLRLPDDDANLSEFNGNYMRIVIDKMAGRVKVSEMTTLADAADVWLNALLAANDFEAAQGMWFRGAIRDGDAYVMVDPRSLRWSSEPAYDGFSGIVAIFDPLTRKPIWACKLWSEADTQDIQGNETEATVIRIMVYEPGKVSWWRGQNAGTEVEPDSAAASVYGGGLKEFALPTIAGEEATPMLNGRVWPLGRIPMVHIANQQDNYTLYGESELRPAVPLQDVYNRTLHSMVMASELAAFRIIWSIGFEIESAGVTPGAVISLSLKNADGEVITDFTPEQIEFIKSAKVGQFDSTDITQYTAQIEQIVKQISQCTQTPIYGVTTEGNLSGEALKQLEIGLIGKIKRFENQNIDALKELMFLTADMQREFTGKGNAPQFNDLAISWQNPEILDSSAQIAALVAAREKAPGLWSDDFYRAKIGALLGMSASEIKKEGDAAREETNLVNETFTGGGGAIPPA